MSGTVTLPYPNVCHWRDEQVSFGHPSTGGCVGWFRVFSVSQNAQVRKLKRLWACLFFSFFSLLILFFDHATQHMGS